MLLLIALTICMSPGECRQWPKCTWIGEGLYKLGNKNQELEQVENLEIIIFNLLQYTVIDLTNGIYES